MTVDRIQDAMFGMDSSSSLPDMASLTRLAGLSCPSVGVSSSLRALFFAADSILCDDAELVIVVGLRADSSAVFLLASPEMVGRLNLLPRARLAARSLAGPDPALRLAGLASTDIEISKTGEGGAFLAHELLDELETRSARWGLISAADSVLLIERI
ncbi:MAG: hypothetical protein ACXVCO_16055 [Ktedonobacterales bacterium]